MLQERFMKQRIKKHTLSRAAARRVQRLGRDAVNMRKLVTKNPGIQELLALHSGVQMTESIMARQNYNSNPQRTGHYLSRRQPGVPVNLPPSDYHCMYCQYCHYCPRNSP